MATELKFQANQNQDRLGFNFIEETGVYSPGNLGGWGAPNPIVGDAVDSRIVITKRGETTSYPVNPFSLLPTSDTEYQYLILGTSFGFAANEKITDGLYKIEYTVDYVDSLGFQQTLYDSFYFAFTKGLECCISNIRESLSVPSGACECDDAAITALSNAETLLNSVCKLVECDKLDKAQEVIDFLQRYCDCNCTTCS